MCMQCVGAVGTALQAVALVGGPVVARNYQRVRTAFGLSDNSVAALEAREREAPGEDLTTTEPLAVEGPRRAARQRPSRALVADA